MDFLPLTECPTRPFLAPYSDVCILAINYSVDIIQETEEMAKMATSDKKPAAKKPAVKKTDEQILQDLRNQISKYQQQISKLEYKAQAVELRILKAENQRLKSQSGK